MSKLVLEALQAKLGDKVIETHSSSATTPPSSRPLPGTTPP